MMHDIVDFHVHVWDGVPRGVVPPGPGRYDVQDLRGDMATAGVSAAAIVTPLFRGSDNHYELSVIGPGLIVFCRVDLAADVDGQLAVLKTLGAAGIRFHLGRDTPDEGAAHRVVTAARHATDAGLAVAVYGPDPQLVQQLADATADGLLLIDHLGLPAASEATTPHTLDDQRNLVAALTGYPHVVLKASALPLLVARWGQPVIQSTLIDCHDSWGPGRIVYGSDHPRMAVQAPARPTYAQQVRTAWDLMAPLGAASRSAVMGSTGAQLMDRLHTGNQSTRIG